MSKESSRSSRQVQNEIKYKSSPSPEKMILEMKSKRSQSIAKVGNPDRLYNSYMSNKNSNLSTKNQMKVTNFASRDLYKSTALVSSKAQLHDKFREEIINFNENTVGV